MENMANAARVHAIESGKDARRRTLVAFGGAAALFLWYFADVPAALDQIIKLHSEFDDPEKQLQPLIDAIEAGGIHDTQLPVYLTVRDSSVCA